MILKQLALAGALCCAIAGRPAMAQSFPGFVTGQVPTAVQWNAAFAAKLDVASVGIIGASMLASGAAASNIGYTPVFNNLGLSALPSSVGKAVRLGFSVLGDSPELTYVASGSACSLNSGAGDGGSQVATSDGKCWLAQFGGVADLAQFGASVSATDNAPAITSWLALAGNVKLTAPCGVFNYTSPLVAAAIATNNIIIKGCGASATTFNYTGTSTTIDLLAIGNAVTNSVNATIENIRVTSSTTMTAGTAIHLKRLGESHLHHITVNGLEVSGGYTPFNGIWFDGVHVVFVDGYEVNGAQGDGILITGNDSSSNTNLFLAHGYSDYNYGAGIHIAGGFGGFFADTSEFMGNGQKNILIDNSLVAAGNREFMFGTTVSCDGLLSTPTCLYVNNTGSYGTIIYNGFLSSAANDGIYVQSHPGGTIQVGGRVVGNSRDGIRVADTAAIVAVSGTIASNSGWGINALSSEYNVHMSGLFLNNTLGDYNANTNMSNTFAGVTFYGGSIQGAAGANTLSFGTNGIQWQISYGNWIPLADNSWALGSSGARISSGYFVNLGASGTPIANAYITTAKISAVTITSLPTCNASNVGDHGFVSNGVTSPTYHLAVSSTGTGQWPVVCAYNGATYSWVY